MQDPKPENIRGAKTVSHSVNHRVDWGYVVGGVGLLVLASVLHRLFTPSAGDEDEGVR